MGRQGNSRKDRPPKACPCCGGRPSCLVERERVRKKIFKNSLKRKALRRQHR